jgi:hypothetical protein
MFSMKIKINFPFNLKSSLLRKRKNANLKSMRTGFFLKNK